MSAGPARCNRIFRAWIDQSELWLIHAGPVSPPYVGRVFLMDMAGLTGVWRAFSFIGLGLVLVGIGYLYQRLLFRKPPEATQAV